MPSCSHTHSCSWASPPGSWQCQWGWGGDTKRQRVRRAGGKRERRGDRRDREKRQADRKKEVRKEEEEMSFPI